MYRPLIASLSTARDSLAGLAHAAASRRGRGKLRTQILIATMLIGAAHQASAYEVLDNNRIRFGTGAEASVNANGNLQQPFYYDGTASQWYKLTFNTYPLDNAIGIDGDGSNEWNTSGTIAQNGTLTSQVLDVSGFTAGSGSKGYGTIVSTGTVTIGGKTLELRNTYELPADKSFVKITTRLTNTSGAAINNVRVWVGTRDDYVGLSDRPTKQRGNLADGAFSAVPNAATRASALKIFSGATGVLFYSTSPKAHTSIQSCCSFASAYGQDPATAQIEATGDGSYALFVRMQDLANGAGEEFTWYYAAGPLAELDTVVGEVAEDEAVSNVSVTASAATGGTISPSSRAVPPGNTAAFTVTPATGYSIADVQGCGGTRSGNTYTTAAVTSACAVTATFSLNNYTVTAVAGTGGAIAPANASVDHNGTTSFNVTPAAGYGIATVQGCGGTLDGSTYTTGAVTAACTVNATFNINTYAVTASAGDGGSISPATATVNHGSATTFTVTPSAGFSVATVAGCDGTLTGGGFTTGPVTGACAITASFSRNQYTVTATAGEGGSIGPGIVQVLYGDIASFAITPAPGYNVSSVSGCGGSLAGTTYSTAAIAGSCPVSANFSIATPIFEPAQPPMIELNARQLFTQIPANSRPRAVAFDGTELEVTLAGEQASGEQTRFQPGEHVLTWQATDSRGVSATVQQTLRIWPTVSFSPDMSIGGQAGNFDFFRIALNGRSPVYPFTVNYSASGDLQGTDLQSGTVVFNAGEVEKATGFAILSTMPAGTPDRHAQLALEENLNRDSDRPLAITLTSLNQPPSVKLAVSQTGETRPSVARDGGPVTIAADIRDPNTNDTHTLQWSGPSGASFTVVGNSIAIQPNSLPAGVHRFELVITDSGSPPVVTRSTFELVVLETLPPAPQGAAGWLPSGLPNHPDYAPTAPNVLPERSMELSHHVMESDPGTQLALGAYSVLHGQYQTELPNAVTSSTLPDDTVVNLGGYFDFVVSDLPRAGERVNVVIPQRTVIPAQPVYRKYDPAANRWMTFVEDADNQLASAPGENGFCPPPTSGDYRAGLTPGDWCVRLTIRDGGPNDSDGQVNGSVSDPGGVGALSNVVVTGEAKGGGGGAFDLWLLCVALLLGMVRRFKRTGRWAVLAALGALSVNATADETSHWYGGASFGQAHSDVSASELTQRLQQQGYDVTATLSDTTRSAWRVHAGYQWSAHLGIEAGYVDLGEVNTRFAGAISNVAQFLSDSNELHPASANGFDVSLAARYEFGSRFSVQARAGAFAWDVQTSTRDLDGTTVRRDDSGTDALFGLGGNLNLGRNWSVTTEGTRYGIRGDHIDFLAAGLVYRWR